MSEERSSGLSRQSKTQPSGLLILLLLGVVWIGCGFGGVYTGVTTLRAIQGGQSAVLWTQPVLFLAVFFAPFLALPIYFVLRLFIPNQTENLPRGQNPVGPGVVSLGIAVVSLGIAFLIATDIFITQHDYKVCIVGYKFEYGTTTLMRSSLIESGGCNGGRVRNWLL